MPAKANKIAARTKLEMKKGKVAAKKNAKELAAYRKEFARKEFEKTEALGIDNPTYEPGVKALVERLHANPYPPTGEGEFLHLPAAVQKDAAIANSFYVKSMYADLTDRVDRLVHEIGIRAPSFRHLATDGEKQDIRGSYKNLLTALSQLV